MATQSIDHLLTLAEGDTAAARWLAGAITRMIQGEGWHAATGIQPYQVARAVRNDHLRHAAGLLKGDPTGLHRQANTFEAILWPHWKRSGPPSDVGPVNRALCLARMAAPSQHRPGNIAASWDKYHAWECHRHQVMMPTHHETGAHRWDYSTD